jgi:hypothetical protein
VQGRIKRVRGFGEMGIEYFYKDIDHQEQQQQKTGRSKRSTSTYSYR